MCLSNVSRRLNGEYQEIKEELKEAVKATGEPSFAQPLVRALFNNVDDMNNDTDLCAQMSIENENKINANNPNNNNRQNERPAMTRTTNAEYGRLAFEIIANNNSILRICLMFLVLAIRLWRTEAQRFDALHIQNTTK